MSGPLHVANGASTTRLIDASGLSGRSMSWGDSLYDGPVPNVPDEELMRVRARFHAPREEDIEIYTQGFGIGVERSRTPMATTSSCYGSNTICSISST